MRRGGHAARLINADERLFFDPAGTWQNLPVPERNDVPHGMTPALWEQYIDHHARQGVEVILQEQPVPLAVAPQAKAAAQTHGAVPKAQCSIATTRILRGLPGSGQMRGTIWPHKAMAEYALLPGVAEQVIRDDDPDHKPQAAARAATADRGGRNEKPPWPGRGGSPWRRLPPVRPGSEQPFALRFLPCQLALAADRFGLLARLLLRRFLVMLLELHFPKHAFPLKFLLQRAERLVHVVVANRYLHVVSPPFLLELHRLQEGWHIARST